LLDNLICNGSEGRLQECRFITDHDCDHSEDAGVKCQCMYILLELSFEIN